MRKTVIYGLVWFAAMQLLIWTVRDASTDDRLLASMLLMAMLLFPAAMVGIERIAPPQFKPKVNAEPMKYLPEVFLGLFLACSMTSSVLTHIENDHSILSFFQESIAVVGSYVFPFISKYETVHGLTGAHLLRVQSIMTTIVSGGLIFTSFLALSALSRANRKPTDWIHPQGRPPFSIRGFVGLVVFVLLFLVAYFGWTDYAEHGSTRRAARRCLVRASCYTSRDDLHLLSAAFFKMMVIAPFPLILLFLHLWLAGQRNAPLPR